MLAGLAAQTEDHGGWAEAVARKLLGQKLKRRSDAAKNASDG